MADSKKIYTIDYSCYNEETKSYKIPIKYDNPKFIDRDPELIIKILDTPEALGTKGAQKIGNVQLMENNTPNGDPIVLFYNEHPEYWISYSGSWYKDLKIRLKSVFSRWKIKAFSVTVVEDVPDADPFEAISTESNFWESQKPAASGSDDWLPF